MSQVADLTADLLEAFLKQPIRQQDVDEWVFLGGGRRVADTLRALALDCPWRRAYLDDAGTPVCLWGATSEGTCWLIAAKAATKHARSIHRLWPQELAQLNPNVALYALTKGNGDERWHRALGFEVLERVGLGNYVSHTIYLRRPIWEN